MRKLLGPVPCKGCGRLVCLRKTGGDFLPWPVWYELRPYLNHHGGTFYGSHKWAVHVC
jgi:hypothetical protein